VSQTTRPIADSLARLERWLAQHRSRYHQALLPGASTAELDSLAKKLGVPLPADLRVLLAWHNGPESAGALVETWLFMGTATIATGKQELDADAATTGWQPAWVPFLDDDQGDYLCLDTSQPLSPLREFVFGKKEHPVIASSLAAWLADFVAALERGEYIEDPERGHFMRRSGFRS
jgi:cell wall assembly regulator SMI1